MHLPGCGGGDSGGGSSSGDSCSGDGSSSTRQELRAILEECAVGVASLLVAAAPALNTGPTTGLGSSGSSSGCNPAPAQLPLPPAPGLPRLRYMLAQAVQVLLPPLSRSGSVCGFARAGALQSVQEMLGGGAAAAIRLVTLLSVQQMKRGGCTGGGSSGGHGNGGSGSGDRGGDSGGDGSSNGGSNTVVRTENQMDASPLVRFLFDGVGVVELLAAVLWLVLFFSDASTPRLASALSSGLPRHCAASQPPSLTRCGGWSRSLRWAAAAAAVVEGLRPCGAWVCCSGRFWSCGRRAWKSRRKLWRR